MPKDKWRNYATKARIKQKGYLRKHRHGSAVGKATKASCSDCVQQSGQKQEEEIKIIGEGNETSRKEQIVETPEEGRQGISVTDKRRSKVEEVVTFKQDEEEKMKNRSAIKEKKHEAKESKKYEAKEDKKEKMKKIATAAYKRKK